MGMLVHQVVSVLQQGVLGTGMAVHKQGPRLLPGLPLTLTLLSNIGTLGPPDFQPGLCHLPVSHHPGDPLLWPPVPLWNLKEGVLHSARWGAWWHLWGLACHLCERYIGSDPSSGAELTLDPAAGAGRHRIDRSNTFFMKEASQTP